MLDDELQDIILRQDLLVDEKVLHILAVVENGLLDSLAVKVAYAVFWTGGGPSLAEDYAKSIQSLWWHVLAVNGVKHDELLGGRGRDVSEVGVDCGVEPAAGQAGVVIDSGQDRGGDPVDNAEDLDRV